MMTAAPRSYRERRRRMCDKKRRVTWRIAHQAVEALRARGWNVHGYLCSHCGSVHVGKVGEQAEAAA